MKVTLKLVRVGMNMQEATITGWYKQPGEHFEEGDPLYAFETEKVNQDVEATGPGTLLEIHAKAGDEVEVGAPICAVETR